MRSGPEKFVRASAGPVLVTGGSGFIASALIAALASTGNVRVSERGPARDDRTFSVGEMGCGADWRRALDGVGTVIHLASPAHAALPREVLQRGIVGGTQELLDQAAAARVGRFILVSSIKACAGASTGSPLGEDDPPRPNDAYGRAKLEAERLVLNRASLRPVVLRPPLVYAPHAKANFAKLLRWCDTSLPLPFAGIDNRRSLLSLSSCVDAIIAVVRHDAAPSGVYHLADEPSVSAAELASLLRRGMGRPPRLFSLPGFAALGPSALVKNLEVDARKFRAVFGYHSVNTHDALVACGRSWRERH